MNNSKLGVPPFKVHMSAFTKKNLKSVMGEGGIFKNRTTVHLVLTTALFYRSYKHNIL